MNAHILISPPFLGQVAFYIHCCIRLFFCFIIYSEELCMSIWKLSSFHSCMVFHWVNYNVFTLLLLDPWVVFSLAVTSLPQWKAIHMSFPTHAGIFVGWISRSGITRSKSKCIWNFNYYQISLHRDCVILHSHHHYMIAYFPRASKNISLKLFWVSTFMWSWNWNHQKLYHTTF